jgi:hypothetical protein
MGSPSVMTAALIGAPSAAASIPTRRRIMPVMGARRQSDQCGGASISLAVVADTTRRLRAGAERSRHRHSRRRSAVLSVLERGAQASFDGRHIVRQVSAPGRI